ncbi:MAG: ABC transporter permease [Chloroflexota bacterium]|nr:ABC transporter permease [Chloroflexota bacterium]
MQRFIVRRFLFMSFSLLVATAVVFGLSRATGDPLLLYAKPGGYGMTAEQIAALTKKLGLDKPLVVQYFMWLGKFVRGDFGRTILDERPVFKVIEEKIFNTLRLGLGAWLWAVLVSVPFGVLSAVRRGTVWDYAGRAFAIFGMCTPAFWIGLMAMLLFSVKLGWLPAGAMDPTKAPFWSWTHIKYYIMPAVIMGWYPAAALLRLTRSAMLDILDSEFIKFARAKGVTGRLVIWKHAFRNALIPPLTMMALTMAGFIGGAVVIETVFAWPGMGRLAVQAIFNNDFPLLQACVLLFAGIFVVTMFVADVLYAYVDPRIRFT